MNLIYFLLLCLFIFYVYSSVFNQPINEKLSLPDQEGKHNNLIWMVDTDMEDLSDSGRQAIRQSSLQL